MIANARMYSVTAEVALLWRRLLTAISLHAGADMTVIEYPEPAPLAELWRRDDLGAVFMCGLPYSRAEPQRFLVAAPVPSPPEFQGEAQYWSNFVVRADSHFHVIGDTFGRRIALTVPDSQSGCAAALSYFMALARETPGPRPPFYAEVVAPTISPIGAMTAVIEGRAEVAPIDAYAWALLRRFRPELTSRLRTVGRTASTPIPPLVAKAPVAEPMRSAFTDAHRLKSCRDLMGELELQRFIIPLPEAYTALRERFATVTHAGGAHWLAAAVHPDFAALHRLVS